MTTLEEISALTRPHHPDDWTDLDTRRGGHRAGAGRRRGAEGRQRPSRYRDEPGAAGVHAVPAADAPRPQRHALAGPRPVRAVVRALQPDAVHPAVPGRLRPGARRHRGAADLEVARPRGTRSSATPRAWRSPPARWARAWPRRWAWRWRRATSAACSTRTPPPGDSPFDHYIYVIASDGDIEEGVTSRGVLAGRHPAAGQPHRVLRQQQDLHRGRHQHRAVRGHRRPATRPTAGTCRRSRAARTSSASRRPSRRPRRSPTSRRSSRCARSSATRRRPR